MSAAPSPPMSPIRETGRCWSYPPGSVLKTGNGRDGADFGSGQGERRERCCGIVTDAATSPWPKIRPPLAVVRIRPAGDVERIVRATSPPCTALLDPAVDRLGRLFLPAHPLQHRQ